MDVRAGAIQEVLQHAVLPLDLDWVGHGVLDPACWPRVTAQVRTAAGYVQCSRPTEFAGIVNLPVTGASEAVRLWRRELKMPLHFLFADGPSPGDEVASAHDPVFDVRSPFFAWDGTQTEGGAARQSVGDERSDALVFAAAAAAARCLDPTSMVLLRETADALRLYQAHQREVRAASRLQAIYRGVLGRVDADKTRRIVEQYRAFVEECARHLQVRNHHQIIFC